MKDNIKTQVTAELKAGIANISITGIIDENSEFNAANIRGLVDDFIMRGVRNANVYISCKGGDVFEATEIDNELSRFDSVTFYVGSVLASAATYLTSNPKFKTYAKANSQVMIHRPSMSTYGDINIINSNAKLLENVTNDYKTRYVAKTGMSENKIEELWSKGDYWMTAGEALQQGFIDGLMEENTQTTTAHLSYRITALDNPEYHGIRANWTLEDYLDKDPDAYSQMKTSNQALAARLEQDYFGGSLQMQGSNIEVSKVSATSYSRASWTLEDYLDKDPAAYAQMKTSNPILAARLESDYFNSK